MEAVQACPANPTKMGATSLGDARAERAVMAVLGLEIANRYRLTDRDAQIAMATDVSASIAAASRKKP